MQLREGARTWAVGAIHGDLDKLKALHATLAEHILPGDQLVYLGDYMGYGPFVRETIDELCLFRRAFIAREGVAVEDLIYLRGVQEEMFQKLMQLQFATSPRDVLTYLSENGVGATVQAYGGTLSEGFSYAREGVTAITRWTTQIRNNLRAIDGHTALTGSLYHAAITPNGALAFVHAGLNPDASLNEQRDLFWWGHSAFDDENAFHPDFGKVVRGRGRKAFGLVWGARNICLDAGSGQGGGLVAALFDGNGNMLSQIQA